MDLCDRNMVLDNRGVSGKHPFFLEIAGNARGWDRWDPCLPPLHESRSTPASGISILFPWLVEIHHEGCAGG